VDEDTDIWDVVLEKQITLSTTSDLLVTACSDVDNPGGVAPNTYLFAIARGTSPGLNTNSERTLDDVYDDPAKNDPDLIHVCSTVFMANVPSGSRTIRWLGAKADAAMLDVTIEDSSMTIAIFD
jgi:hypothetical protein